MTNGAGGKVEDSREPHHLCPVISAYNGTPSVDSAYAASDPGDEEDTASDGIGRQRTDAFLHLGNSSQQSTLAPQE